MSRQFLTGLNLNKNELLNARIQNLSGVPSNPAVGQIYFDTSLGHLRQWDGAAWLTYSSLAELQTALTTGTQTNITVTFDAETGLYNFVAENGVADSTTDDLVEGTNNLYFTAQRAIDAVGGAATSLNTPDTVVLRDGTGSFAAGTVTAETQVLTPTVYGGNGLLVGYAPGFEINFSDADGNIYITPGGGTTQVNGNVFKTTYNNGDYTAFQVDSAASTTTVRNELSATTDNGVSTVFLNGNSEQISFYNVNSDINSGYLGTNGSGLKLSGYSDLALYSNNGDINLYPDGQVVAHSNLSTSSGYSVSAANNLYAGSGLYIGGQDWGNDGYVRVQKADGTNLFTVDTNSGEAEVDIHGFQKFYTSGGTQYGAIGYDGGANLIVNGYNNDVILTSDSGYAYIGNNSSPATRIATWDHVSSVASGLNVKESVLLAVSEPVDLAVWNADGGSLDGNGAIQAGQRVLLLAQGDGTENGIYVVNSTTYYLERVADQLAPEQGDYVFVETGTHAAQGYIVTSIATNVIWTQFSAAGEYTAGDGIDISGTSISVKLDSDSLSESGSGLKVNYHTDGGLDNDGGLYVKLGTGLAYDNSGNVAFAAGYGIQKYAETNEALTAISGSVTWPVTHNIGTRDVTIQLFDLDTYEQVEVDVVRTSTSVVTLSWVSGDVSANSYRVVVVG
jgi:Flp pilus assembly protein TadG